jgi:hypothetical protein
MPLYTRPLLYLRLLVQGRAANDPKARLSANGHTRFILAQPPWLKCCETKKGRAPIHQWACRVYAITVVAFLA